METKIIKVPILRITDREQKQTEDIVVREFKLTIQVNGKELVSILCSPEKLEYLAVGYLLSQGFITAKDDIKEIKVDEQAQIVYIDITEEIDISFKSVIASSGGKDAVLDDMPGVSSDSNIKITPAQVFSLVDRFVKRSKVFENTGAIHSAALCDPDKMLIFSEDIGRHNAVDKIFGESILKDISLKDRLILTSGRVPSEIFIKAARRSIPILISKSAPTDISIELANQLGLTLIGFVRGKKMNVYTNHWRVITDAG